MSDDEIPESGAFAVYQGRRHKILFGSDDYVGVARTSEAKDDWPDALELGDRRGEPWVKLPRHVVEGVVAVKVDALWNGEVIRVVRRRKDGNLDVSYIGPPDRARAIGMTGDQYQGWRGIARAEELTVTEVAEEVRWHA